MQFDPEILKEFKDLDAFKLWLKEKVNDGEQISKGKDGDDDSKEKKKEEAPEKPDPAGDKEEESEEGEDEAPPEQAPNPMADGGDAAAVAGEQTPVDPVAMPGSQVAMGGIKNKDKDKDEPNPHAVEIDISGKKDKIKMRPTIELDPNGFN